MSDTRLAIAQAHGILPELSGPFVVFGPATPAQLAGFNVPDAHLVQSSYRLTQMAQNAGLIVSQNAPDAAACALVTVPRAKAEAMDLIGQAAACVQGGWIVVDGAKTDGIDSLLKAIRRQVPSVQSYSKAHGKCLWMRADDARALMTWRRKPQVLPTGWNTAPGVFSADAIDPASEMLIAALPALSGNGADLGAGWGYLASEVLRANPGVTRLDLVEDNAAALECAQRNTSDARAQFHWADALSWQPEKPLDWIIMNPPFHDGRKAAPEVGQAFIARAAQLLRPGGQLYMVANGHLPYRDTLDAGFFSHETLAKSSRFTVTSAQARRSSSHRR